MVIVQHRDIHCSPRIHMRGVVAGDRRHVGAVTRRHQQDVGTINIVVDDVGQISVEDRVPTHPAVDHIGPRTAVDTIRPRAAIDHVAAGAAADPLDAVTADDHVIAALRVDDMERVPVSVVARSAVEFVVTSATARRVAAGAADQPVTTGTIKQHINAVADIDVVTTRVALGGWITALLVSSSTRLLYHRDSPSR